ncbi:MAG: hypothetical protein AB1473_10900 [Thermodesulfobacteriota bacterium]
MEDNTANLLITGLLTGSFTLLATAATSWFNLHNSNLQRGADEKKRVREKKEDAYLQCLKLLWESRCRAFQHNGKHYLDAKDFAGRMQTIQHVEPWMIFAENYSSQNSSKVAIRGTCRILRIVVDLQHRKRKENFKLAGEEEEREWVIDCGIPKAVDNALGVVRECSIVELKERA